MHGWCSGRLSHLAAVALVILFFVFLVRKVSIMKKIVALLSFALFALFAAPWAYAEDFKDLRAKMTTARETLASASLGKLKAPAGKEAQFKDLVDTWGAFKKTRETELVPLILAGKEDEALKLAGGIQKERINKCMTLLGELGG
jgi:hypothetical protein